MTDVLALNLVQQALQLAQDHPHVAPLDVLDLVMEGYLKSDFCFETWGQPFADWTDPPSPFGELLRKAFAPDEIRADIADLWLSDDPRHDELWRVLVHQWQTLVVDRFGARYQLWCA